MSTRPTSPAPAHRSARTAAPPRPASTSTKAATKAKTTNTNTRSKASTAKTKPNARPKATSPTSAAPLPRGEEREGRDGLEARKADVVADALLRAIVRGEYPVGSTLPREDELAHAHGTSRGVLREAIKLLEVHRLVRPVRRRGTEVLDPMRSLTPEVVRVLLQPTRGRIDPSMLRGLLEVRALLDVEMSALAAARRTSDDLRALDAFVAAQRGRVDDPAAYLRAAPGLSTLVARAAQNPILEMLAAWNELVARDLATLFAATRPAPGPHVEGLAMLVELVRRRDVEEVRSLVGAFHAWQNPRLLAAAELLDSAHTFPTSASAHVASDRPPPRSARAVSRPRPKETRR